jgi:hypothetical protein
MQSVRRIAMALVALWASAQAPPTTAEAAEEGAFYGLLRSRDLSPFGFLRLDMRPAHAVAIEPGTWAIETEIAHQNTWALSPEVEDYLVSLEPTGRRDLGEAEVEAIQQLPGENYLLDLEATTFDFTLHYKLSYNWTVYAVASAIWYESWHLDSAIEQFHDTFGFSTFGRPAVTRNKANLIYDLKSAQVVFLGDTPTDGGLTDPTIGLRYVGIELSPKWRLTLEAAVKVPVGGRRLLLSTGRTDYGVQASAQRLGSVNAFYVDAAAVYYAGTTEPAPQSSQVIPTLVFGWERKLTARTNLNLQGYISRSVYSHDETDVDELLGEKYQYTIGLRHRIENFVLSFGLTENLQNINNTPDLGFQLGLAWVPRRAAER